MGFNVLLVDLDSQCSLTENRLPVEEPDTEIAVDARVRHPETGEKLAKYTRKKMPNEVMPHEEENAEYMARWHALGPDGLPWTSTGDKDGKRDGRERIRSAT